MAANPISSINLGPTSSAVELLVNYELGPARATGRMPVAAARQLLMSSVAPPVTLPSELTLDWPAGVEARVYGLAGPAGVYRKNGPSGSGSWVRVGPLPEADVSNKADASALAAEVVARQADVADLQGSVKALPTRLAHRPGEAREAFTRSTAGGPAENLPIFDGTVTLGPRGYVFQAIAADQIVQRVYTALEPGRSYLVRASYSRAANAPDPANDAIRVALIWYDQARNPLVATPYTVVIDDLGLTTASGLKKVSRVFATAAGDTIDIVAPAGAVYARATVVTFGGEQRTNIEILTIADLTDATLYSPDLSSLEARVTAQESLDLGARQDVLEAAVNTPNSVTYPTLLDAEAASVPATADVVTLLGRGAAADLGEARHGRSASEPSHPGKFTSTDGAHWEMKPGAVVRPEQLGSVDIDEATTKATFNKAASFCRVFGTKLRLAGRTYDIGDSSGLDLSGVWLDPEPGAVLRGDYQLPKKGYHLTRPLTFQRTEAGNSYLPTTQPTKHRRPLADKEVFYGEGDIDREDSIAVDGSSMLQQEFVFASPAGWSNIASYADADSVVFTLANDRLQGCFKELYGGDCLHTIFNYGDYRRAAVVRTVNGFYYMYTDGFDGSAGPGALYWQPYGGTASLVTAIDWQGRVDVEHWHPGYAAWSIEKFSPLEFGFRLNGMLLVGGSFTVNAGDLITDVGFAVSGTSGTGGVGWTTLTRGAKVAGRGYVDILCAGDSRTAPNYACWPDLLKEKLEGALGTSVLNLKNIAEDGATTETTYNKIIANGFSGVSILALAVGGNDAQNLISLATTRAKYLAIIDAAQAANVRVVCILFPDWYSAGSAGQGSATYNNAFAPQYRTMIRKLAAMRGCAIVDLSQEMKPVLPYEAQEEPNDPRFKGTTDSGFPDNMHFAGHLHNLTADAGTRRIIGLLPKRRRGFDEIMIPSKMLSTGWTSGLFDARIAQSDEGRISLAGRLAAGTKTAGTQIIALPPTLRPFQRRSFRLFTDNNASIRVDVEPTEIKLVDALGGADGSLILDGLSWQAA